MYEYGRYAWSWGSAQGEDESPDSLLWLRILAVTETRQKMSSNPVPPSNRRHGNSTRYPKVDCLMQHFDLPRRLRREFPQPVSTHTHCQWSIEADGTTFMLEGARRTLIPLERLKHSHHDPQARSRTYRATSRIIMITKISYQSGSIGRIHQDHGLVLNCGAPQHVYRAHLKA